MAETAHNVAVDPLEPRLLVAPHHDDKSLNDTLLNHVWAKPGKGWFLLFGMTLSALGLLVIGVT